MPKGSDFPLPYRKFLKQVACSQVLAIGLSPFLPLTAVAQNLPAPSTTGTTPHLTLPSTPLTGSTILPTDVLPLTGAQERIPFGENLQLRLNQYLPSAFYFSASVESSFRLETNPFQFPQKRDLMRQLPAPAIFHQLNSQLQYNIRQVVRQADSQDMVFRVLPNFSAGWTLTPRTRVYGNFFSIRDSLFKNVRLNTMIYSYAWGAQHDFPLGSRANLQIDFQSRELNQMHQKSVFDFLPGLTLSYIMNPKTVLFANSLIQIRGRRYFQAPTREFDPFYTIGGLYSRGGWTFSASSTLVQNFRNQFGNHAQIPVNNYVIISDFEIARRLFRQLPGVQAFVRAEPIFNMHSHNRPGLAGTDFRLFWGLRAAMAKPALTSTIMNIRDQLLQQENEPPGGRNAPKPSAYLPSQVIAGLQQPIHGYRSEAPEDLQLAATTAAVKPDLGVESPVVANSDDTYGGTAAGATGEQSRLAALPEKPSEQPAPALESADWENLSANAQQATARPIIALEPLRQTLFSSAAITTDLAYGSTSKRADIIAHHIERAPAIELANNSNWNEFASAAQGVPSNERSLQRLALNEIASQAADETTKRLANDTAVRVAKLTKRQQLIELANAGANWNELATHAQEVLSRKVCSDSRGLNALAFVSAADSTRQLAAETQKRVARWIAPEQPQQLIAKAEQATKPSAASPARHIATALAAKATDGATAVRAPRRETSVSLRTETQVLSLEKVAFDWSSLSNAASQLHSTNMVRQRLLDRLDNAAALTTIASAHASAARISQIAHNIVPEPVAVLAPKQQTIAAVDRRVDARGTAQTACAPTSLVAPPETRLLPLEKVAFDWSSLAAAANEQHSTSVDRRQLLERLDNAAALTTLASAQASAARTSQLARHIAPTPKAVPVQLADLSNANWDTLARIGMSAAPQLHTNASLARSIAQQAAASSTQNMNATELRVASLIQKINRVTAPAVPEQKESRLVVRMKQTPLAAATVTAQKAPPAENAQVATAPAKVQTTQKVAIETALAQQKPAEVKLFDLHAADWDKFAAFATNAASAVEDRHGFELPLASAAAATTSDVKATEQRLAMFVQHIAPPKSKTAASVQTIDIASAPVDWEPLAQLSLRRIALAPQYLGSFRQFIKNAADESARNLNYALLHTKHRVQIAARAPIAAPSAKPMSSPVIWVPPTTEDYKVDANNSVKDRTGNTESTGIAGARPQASAAIASERPRPQVALPLAVDRIDNTPVQKPRVPATTQVQHASSRIAPKTVNMRIVPPLPTVHMKDKENPFKGLDLKKPFVLSLPR